MRILYIDIDSLRPDRLGCYGYHRPTSPNIDAIAAEGFRFDRCHTPDAPCLPSRTAMYSGRFGIQTGVVGHGGTAAQPRIQGRLRGFRDHFDEQGLARQLQKLGLHTAMISPFGQRHAAHWFYAGFNEIHNTGQGGMESAEVVQPVVDRWLDANAKSDNWYLHINFWDPHTPYRTPADYPNHFAELPLPAHLDSQELLDRHMKMTGPHTALDFMMYDDRVDPKYPKHPGKISNLGEMRQVVDGYDSGVRYVDDQIGRIIAHLKRTGVYDDTVIVISADHGENFGELGLYGEHATADSATCRIPMIVRFPGKARACGVSDALVYNIDLAPTLMDLLGGEHQPLWDGQSFAPELAGKSAGRRDHLVLSQCAHVCQRSVRWDDWLYVRTHHCGFHLFPDEMLFDLKSDPHEQNDLAPVQPAICARAARDLERWHSGQMEKVARVFPHDVTDPMQRVLAEGGPFHALHDPERTQLGKYLTRLERTGRADGAARLRAKYMR
jgi:choline-sulfatase